MKNESEFPLVSLLIANLNNAEYIVDTLDSALNQTYPNIEIIVVDDASTDNSVEVIGNYIESHPEACIQLFRNYKNWGCGRVKRKCADIVRGKYFAFLDPEDAIDAEAVEKLVSIHEKDYVYSIVYCTHYLCNERLEPQSVSTWPGAIPKGQSHLTSKGGHVSAFAMCKKECYDQTEGINPLYYVAEDQDLYFKMEEIAPVFFLNEPLYYYRKHDHNTSWDVNKADRNYYWYFQASLCAYQRRKRGTLRPVPNYTLTEINKYRLSFHIKFCKLEWRQHNYLKSIGHGVAMLPVLYTLTK